MAAKIDHARLQADRSQTVWASEYDKQEHGTPLCPDRRCDCVLEGVHASTRNVGDQQVEVAAFFRLPRNAEASGRGHTAGCHYNVERTVARLVARSREIKKFDGNAVPLLDKARGHGAEFRLHILMEMQRVAARSPMGAEADSAASKRPFAGTRYVRSPHLLKPYLRMARAVLSLVARVRERPELARWITLTYSHMTVAWHDYFFDLGELGKLYDHLHGLGQFRWNAGNNQPVATVINIARTPVREAKHGQWQVAAIASEVRSDRFGTILIRPRIYVRGRRLANLIAAEQCVLLCAVPTASPVTARGEPSAALWFTIVDRSQVCRYPVMPRQQTEQPAGGGRPLPPRTP